MAVFAAVEGLFFSIHLGGAMMKKLLTILAVALVASGTASAADTLRMGTEGAYPPFNMIDSNGKLQGFDVDIGNALCEEMKVKCTWVTQDWDGIIPGLLAKKYDTIIASMSITDERKKAVDFTGRYYSNKLSFIRKKGASVTQDTLKGKTLGAQRATIAAQHIEKAYGKDVDVKLYDTQENAFLDLASGRLDVMVVDFGVGYTWLESDEGKDFEFFGKAADIDDRIGIAVRKGSPELVGKLNAAIKAIRENGTYAKINAKYFPFDIY